MYDVYVVSTVAEDGGSCILDRNGDGTRRYLFYVWMGMEYFFYEYLSYYSSLMYSIERNHVAVHGGKGLNDNGIQRNNGRYHGNRSSYNTWYLVHISTVKYIRSTLLDYYCT